MSVDELFKQGIHAYKAKEMKRARQLLEQVIAIDNHHEKAWLWMSGVVDNDQERLICLENVLAINPDNSTAQSGLQIIRGRGNGTLPSDGTVPIAAEPISEVTQDNGAALSFSTPTPYAAAPANGSAPANTNPATGERAKNTVQATAPNRPKKRAEKGNPSLDNLLLIGAVGFLLLVMFISAVLLLPKILNGSTADEEAPAEVAAPAANPEAAVMAVIRENMAAYAVEDIDRYMATIHSGAAGYDETRENLTQLLGSYNLAATLDEVEVISVSEDEARVQFVLTTTKLSGPAFRNNQIEGVFILRQQDGRWKLYNQTIDNITYLD